MEVINEVTLNLKDFIEKLLPEQIANGLEMAGTYTQNIVKGNTPVATGILRNSISHVVNNEKKECVVGTNVEYAPYVEMKKEFFQSTVDGDISGILDAFQKGAKL